MPFRFIRRIDFFSKIEAKRIVLDAYHDELAHGIAWASTIKDRAVTFQDRAEAEAYAQDNFGPASLYEIEEFQP